MNYVLDELRIELTTIIILTDLGKSTTYSSSVRACLLGPQRSDRPEGFA